jgi:hypothetical protein
MGITSGDPAPRVHAMDREIDLWVSLRPRPQEPRGSPLAHGVHGRGKEILEQVRRPRSGGAPPHPAPDQRTASGPWALRRGSSDVAKRSRRPMRWPGLRMELAQIRQAQEHRRRWASIPCRHPVRMVMACLFESPASRGDGCPPSPASLRSVHDLLHTLSTRP